MKKQFEIFKVYREELIKTVDGLELEQLQKIPKGFNNSIFWNLAHVLIIQQLSHYKLSDLDILITNDWVENYKKGTIPKFLVNEDELEYVKRILIKSTEELELDYDHGKFVTYTQYETSMGVILTSIEDAVNYNNAHEGLHLGIVKSMKKLVI